MPLREPSAASRQFHRHVAHLRAKIETLPMHCRSALRALVDEAQHHHDVRERECMKMRDLIDDMRLREASVKFNLWAMKGNLRRKIT
ncbi:MAG: hypothetical protein RBS80_19300 [Thermoguttaceae bacterium]|nr:hypothetical protein [Thermoguttaceae bacterium]